MIMVNLLSIKRFGVKDVSLAIFFWTIGLGFLFYWMSGQRIASDTLIGGLSFTAQQRQVKEHLDGCYTWLLVDFLSFMLFISIGNQIIAFNYLGMSVQGLVGIMIWREGRGQA